MEISQLKTFHEIVKTGSCSKAAKNLFLTQSAVSHQIINLEKELGIKLFERVGNIFKLTDKGTSLLDPIIHVLDEVDTVKRISEDIRNSKTSHLTIATTSGIMINLLPDVVRKYRQRFPQIRLKLITTLLSEFLPLVLNDDVDLAIGPILTEVLPNRINFRLWKSFERLLLTPKGHPLSKKRTLRLADISPHPLILYRKGTQTRKAVEDAFSEHELAYQIIMEIDVAENAKRYVQLGTGISIVPSLTVSKEDRRRLACIDVSYLFGKVDYGIYLRKHKGVSPAANEFVRLFAPEVFEKFS